MFMVALRKYLVGAVIGLIVGLWFGVNIGKGQPFYSNPFAERSLADIAKDKTKEIVQESKEKLREKLKD